MSETVFFLNLAVLAVLLALSGPVGLGLALSQRRRIGALERRLAAFEAVPPLAEWPSADSAFAQPGPVEPDAPRRSRARPPRNRHRCRSPDGRP